MAKWEVRKSEHSAFWGIFIADDYEMPVARTLTRTIAERIADDHNQVEALKAERGRLLVVLELAEHVVSDVQVSDYEGLLSITQRHIDDLRKAIEEAALSAETAEPGEGG